MSRIVIVGAGSAGCVLAARLTERGENEVVLIEAGPDYPPSETLPSDLANGKKNSIKKHDWGYRHRPTKVQVIFPLPRGKVVGGSSAVNTCIALRGQPWDYDEWADRGMPEWSWDKCLPAFQRLERDLDFGDDPYHGDDGPLPIRRHKPSELVDWQAAFVEACAIRGYPSCDDSNKPGSYGAGPHAMNKIDNRRISAAESWLTADVRARDSLTIRPGTLIQRILFRGRTATGVITTTGETIDADEVIVSCGAINTPALLLRSGVGPLDQLEALGVRPVAINNNVNRRLLDHPGTAIFFRPRFLSGMDRKAPLVQTVLRYGSAGSPHDNDMLIQPGSRVIWEPFTLPLLSIMCSVGKPRGTGQLRFTSTEPTHPPTIDSMLLEDDADRSKAVEAMQMAADLAATAPMRKLARHIWPSKRVLRSADRTDAWIRKACDSGYHPSGTVPMGADDDPEAATDPRGYVRGVDGLRVIDASLMPTIPSANIHLATLMIAERMAETF